MDVNEYGKYIGKLFDIVTKNDLTVLGAPMSIYYGSEFDENANDTEIAIPIKEHFKGTRVFPGGLYATATIQGGYSNLSAGYEKLIEWINKNNYKGGNRRNQGKSYCGNDEQKGRRKSNVRNNSAYLTARRVRRCVRAGVRCRIHLFIHKTKHSVYPPDRVII